MEEAGGPLGVNLICCRCCLLLLSLLLDVGLLLLCQLRQHNLLVRPGGTCVEAEGLTRSPLLLRFFLQGGCEREGA